MSSHFVILGAGISGLATAWFLKHHIGSKGRITILEKNHKAGGCIQTLQSEGFLFEQGPHSCRTRGKGEHTLALVEALGLQEHVLTPRFIERYIWTSHGLKRLPDRLWKVPFNPLTRGWAKALWRDLTMEKRKVGDETIYTFFTRRLGQAWAEQIIDPFVLGIYAGDCRRLSLKSCFPAFDEWEQKQGSLIKGLFKQPPQHSNGPLTPFMKSICRFPLFSFKEGMETLTKTLVGHLSDSLHLGKEVVSLHFLQNNVEIKLKEGTIMKADHVVSTLPAPALANLFKGHVHVANELKQLPYATIIVVNIGFDRAVMPFEGFGYLVPSKEKMLILGCIWDSSLFPQQGENQTRLTMMLGGMHYPDVAKMSDSEIKDYVLKILAQHMGIRASPCSIQIKKAMDVIPQFETGFSIWKTQIKKEIEQLTAHLSLGGSTWWGVSINDCIYEAKQLGKNLSYTIK